MSTGQGSLLIRPALALEIEPLLTIERAAQSHPWSESQLLQSLHDDIVFVAQYDTQIIAWGAFQVVLDESTLLNIAVMPSFRRQGIARRLLEHAFAALRHRGCKQCFLEVRASNTSAIALYQQMGFVFDGIRKNYYPAQGADGAREDAHLFHADW